MLGIASLSAVAAALLFSPASAVPHISSTDAAASHNALNEGFDVATSRQTAVLRNGSPNSPLKVDVFLDVASADSAFAWPALMKIASEYGYRTDFIFHVFAWPHNQRAFDVAKAIHVVRECSGGNDKTVEGFIDWVFQGDNIDLDDNQMKVNRANVHKALVEWAVGADIAIDQFKSGMDDPKFDQFVINQLGNNFILDLSTTPIVLLNGNNVDLGDTKDFHSLWLMIDAGLAIISDYDDDVDMKQLRGAVKER